MLSGYEWMDFNPSDGRNYYRIQYVFSDGSSYYSRVLTWKSSTASGLTLYPNPASASFQLDFEGSEEAQVEIYGLLQEI